MAQIAIIHFTNYPKGQSRACMGAVMKYTKQEKKTLWEGRQLVSGINCRPESVYDDFLRTKLLYHKEDGTMFYHMVQSFPADEEVDPAAAHAAALALAEWFQGREVLVCTHVDRDHIHSHFLINSVSFEDGKKLHISEPELIQLRQRNDQVCAEFGLPVFQPQKKRVKSMSGAEYHAAASGESWKFRLMNTIDECMQYARSREEFITLMRSEGYDVRWTDSRRNITYTVPGGMRCRDDRLHDEKYLKERMELEFRIRQAVIHGGAAPAEYTEASARGGATPHDTGVVRVDRCTDGNGRSPDGAGTSAGGIVHKAQPLDNAGTDRGADSGGKGGAPFAGTGWEEERTALFSTDDPAASALAGMAAGPSGAVGIAGAVVRLGRTLERSDGPVPINDAAAVHRHTDSKTLRREREKKIALGHKGDNHEDTQTWQQTM